MNDDIDADLERIAVEIDQLKQGPMGSEVVRGDREIQFQVARMAYKALENLGLTGKYKVKIEVRGGQAEIEIYLVPEMKEIKLNVTIDDGDNREAMSTRSPDHYCNVCDVFFFDEESEEHTHERPAMNIKNQKTERGFVRIEFEDYDGESCSLQESSLADDRCIWLGVNDAKPQFCIENYGWKPYPVPDGVMFTTRMHLTREQLAALMPYFAYFIENGELPEIPQEET